MGRKKTIDEWALDYWLFQKYVKLCYRLFYRRVTVIGAHNIPKHHPVILAPNHQNALMDALAIVCNTDFQCVFLARADIFKGKWLIRFLTYLNIMPVYRIRDGIDKVKQNDVVFDKTVEVLHRGLNPLCIFPEGNHGDKRRLRPLVKGLFRIAFQAQESFGTRPGVKIVPMGIEYGHYQNFRSDIFVNVGKPLEVSDYMEAYKTNPVAALNQMKDDFADALGKLMIDIQTEKYYELYQDLRGMVNQEMRHILGIKACTPETVFFADKVLIQNVNEALANNPEQIEALDVYVTEYLRGLKTAGLQNDVIAAGKASFIRLMMQSLLGLLILPVYFFGLIHNYLPYAFTSGRVKNIKDLQFHSSVKFVVAMVVFPLWYMIIAGLLCFTPLPAISKLIYLLMIPTTGLCAFGLHPWYKKLKSKYRLWRNFTSPSVQGLVHLREQIIEIIQNIGSRSNPMK